VNINKNAESIFYTRNENQELIGIDKAKSGSINMLFANGDIEEYMRTNSTDGTLFPEEDYQEKDKFLKGFDWRADERPTNVKDLFKDEKPFKLPVIEGLKDYVPQENFFDEDLLQRIEKAGNNTGSVSINSTNKEVFSENNLLKSSTEFDSKDWVKTGLKVDPNITKSPNGKKTADNIYRSTTGKGWITQYTKASTGAYIFTIWLKGKGDLTIELRQENNNKLYKAPKISLEPEWKKHKIEFKKEDSTSNIKIILSSIDSKDSISVWGAALIKVKENN